MLYDLNVSLERWELRHSTCRDESLGDAHFQTAHGRERVQADEYGRFVVPPDHFFVMGDHRDNSYDSRFWGPVPRENVTGTVLFVWWSTGEPEGVRTSRLGTWIY